MSYSEENGQVVLTMSRDQFGVLLMALGFAIGGAMKQNDTEIASRFVRLSNSLNEGNPNYTPYKVEQMSEPNISVELTDPSEFHCFKVTFRVQPSASESERVPLEIFLHTTQAIDLLHKLSLAICEKHRQDSADLLKSKYGITPSPDCTPSAPPR